MKNKPLRLAAVTVAAVMTLSTAGCGQEIDGGESSLKKVETVQTEISQTQESGKDTSGAEQTTSKSADSSQAQEQSSSKETTTAQSGGDDSTTTSKAVTAAPATTTSTAKTTSHDETGTENPDANYATIPKSGQWIGGVVVCDRNKGADIRGLIGFGADEGCGRLFTSMVNDMKKMVGDGVNVYTLPAPVSSAYYTPKGMTGVTSDQHKATLDLNKTLDPKVKNIDVYSVLAQHTNEYIYYRTDHHWTTLAAYYAVKEFAAAANVPFADLSNYEKCVKTGFTGSMYTYSNCPEFLKYPDTYTYYKPKNSYTTTYYNGYFQNPVKSSLFFDYAQGSGCYCTILGTDNTIAEIKTDVKNGRTLVLIKDSYGNALTPYFVGSFEKIYVLDMRYTHVNLRNFFKQVGATDILFGSSISSFYTPSRVQGIRAIM